MESGNDELSENPASSRNPKPGTPQVWYEGSLHEQVSPLRFRHNEPAILVCASCKLLHSTLILTAGDQKTFSGKGSSCTAESVCAGKVAEFDVGSGWVALPQVQQPVALVLQAFSNEQQSPPESLQHTQQVVAGLAGLLAMPIVAWSEYTLKTTGEAVEPMLCCLPCCKHAQLYKACECPLLTLVHVYHLQAVGYPRVQGGCWAQQREWPTSLWLLSQCGA